jgi:epoxyqueuosine reductase
LTNKELKELFESRFDVCGIIHTKRYLEEAKKMGKNVPHVDYQTMVVLGLAYPMRFFKHTNTHLVPSFYTFGSDYHQVLKKRIDDVMKDLPYPYELGVDNHPHNERLAATLAGIGFFGKNQLIINKDLGTYMFLGLVFIDLTLENEFILEVTDDCGTCRKCIDACPPGALYEGGFDVKKCMSHYNQTKKVLSDDEIDLNYSLFGCDICQMVCPKNFKKGTRVHSEFELSGKEMVSIVDLFTNSEKEFKNKYSDMSFLWKGKTILMRNALTILQKQNNSNYNDLIELSIQKHQMPWYQETAIKILDKLKQK